MVPFEAEEAGFWGAIAEAPDDKARRLNSFTKAVEADGEYCRSISANASSYYPGLKEDHK
jgi:hypothetical protein